jgi:hypothetical protein
MNTQDTKEEQSGQNLNLANPNLPASEQFGAYKVGEFVQGQKPYSVEEVTGGPARQDAQPNMMQGIQNAVGGGDTDFKRKHGLKA